MPRLLAIVFAIVAAVTVALGYVPQFITPVNAEERMLFDLFMVSLLDDITHGLTALAALVAALHSERASLLFLTAFGWYYALDAVFYLTYGFFNERTWMGDLMLNLPHVLIAGVMLGAVYWMHPRRAVAAPRP